MINVVKVILANPIKEYSSQPTHTPQRACGFRLLLFREVSYAEPFLDSMRSPFRMRTLLFSLHDLTGGSSLVNLIILGSPM